MGTHTPSGTAVRPCPAPPEARTIDGWQLETCRPSTTSGWPSTVPAATPTRRRECDGHRHPGLRRRCRRPEHRHVEKLFLSLG